MSQTRLCAVNDVPLWGGRLFMDVGGTSMDVLVFRLSNGSLRAYDARCPHAGALLRPENETRGRLICRVHQWAFDIATGLCETTPGIALERLEIERDGRDLYVALPAE